MNSIPWMAEIYGMKIHPKFIHHVSSHLYWIFPILLLKMAEIHTLPVSQCQCSHGTRLW